MYYRVKTSERKIRRDLNSALGNDILRYIVELVTNADDSYKRLGEDAPLSKIIQIELTKKNGKYVFSVTDNAEGMTTKRLVEVFGEYGNDNAGGLKSGSRGIFGQGASDVLQAAANQRLIAKIETIKDGIPSRLVYKFDLNKNEKGIDVDKLSLSANRMAEYRKSLGIQENGTRVTFGVPENVKMDGGVIKKLPDSLEKSPYLRYILSRDDNTVVFKNGDRKRILSSKRYLFDEEKKISEDSFEFDFEGKKVRCKLLTYHKEDKKDNSAKIIVKDGRDIVYANTMFDFERSAAAQNIFGELIVEDLYELCYDHLNRKYPDAIVEENRTGFDEKNPFYKLLSKNVGEYLSIVLEQSGEASKPINLNNNKRLNKALKILNRYMKSELKDSIPSEGGNIVGNNPPVEGIKFVRNAITITKDKQYDLKLYINSELVAPGEKIAISCDSNGVIEFSPSVITFNDSETDNGLVIKSVVIKGLEVTDDSTIIEAKTSTRTATATIDVIEEDIHYPNDGFEIYPNEIVFAGTGKHIVKLYVDKKVIPVDSFIHVQCDGLECRNNIIFCDADLINDAIGVINIEVSGGKIGDNYAIIANSLDKTAEAVISIVEDNRHEPQGGGLISGIDMEPNEGDFQAYYHPYTHKIVINSLNEINRIAMDPIDSIDVDNPTFGKKTSKYLCDIIATQAAILLVKQQEGKKGVVNNEDFDSTVDEFYQLMQVHKNKIYPGFYAALCDTSKE